MDKKLPFLFGKCNKTLKVYVFVVTQDIPEELVLMAERYEKHKREKEMSNAREGPGRGGGRWRRDGEGRGGRDHDNWSF